MYYYLLCCCHFSHAVPIATVLVTVVYQLSVLCVNLVMMLGRIPSSRALRLQAVQGLFLALHRYGVCVCVFVMYVGHPYQPIEHLQYIITSGISKSYVEEVLWATSSYSRLSEKMPTFNQFIQIAVEYSNKVKSFNKTVTIYSKCLHILMTVHAMMEWCRQDKHYMQQDIP